MRREFIKTLHCPYSGSRFVLDSVIGGNDVAVTYAVATSEAGHFPVVDGILRLKVDEYRSPLVELIRRDQPKHALLTAFEAPPYGPIGRGINFLDRTSRSLGLHRVAECVTAAKRPTYNTLIEANGTLATTMDKLKSRSWANWQIYRFSMPNFLPVYGLLHLVKESGPVLDFGCGVGHAAFLMARRVPEEFVTCADVLFQALFLARKFFVPKANFVCVDGEYLLPFESRYFSTVFSSDAMHFIDSKLSLANEFRRVLSEDGTILLPHLHNRLSAVRSWKSLSPDGYRALFADVETRMLAEESLVAQFFERDALDLSAQSARNELDNAVRGLSMVVSADKSVFRRYDRLWSTYLQSMINPAMNPVYAASRDNGGWKLQKHVAASQTAKLAPGGRTYLPDCASVSMSSLDSKTMLTLRESDEETFGKLAKQLIVIDVPQRFH